MTKTPKYLQADCDGILHGGPEMYEMEKFCMAIADINRYAEEYIDEGTAFYMDDVLIDTDAWVHEECEDHKVAAILAYHRITEEELDAWGKKHEEVAFWVASVSRFADCDDPDLKEFIDSYDSEAEDEEED